jgi:uncharacterized protein YjbI with pentapeptide repeats
MRLSYDESCQFLGCEPSEIPPLKNRPPRYDDEILGLSFYKTGIEQQEWRSLTIPRTFVGRSLIEAASIIDCDLSESVMCWNDFNSVDFSRSDLVKTDMKSSNFIGVDFSGCNLSEADFRGSGLERCNFQGANLDGAILETRWHGDLPFTQEQKASIAWVDEPGEPPPGG